ncbi:MAG: pyridoxal-phosphate dependent enzyme [Candidatus Staskawiczbacteria bacterium]|nr:pyridoxal-phosphate dependent enzyme [Candidatus Staskawiczbacteria bacterium]
MNKPPFDMKQTWLECIKCGHQADLLQERKFRCPQCGNLYDVMHDFSHLPNADILKQTFADRMMMFNHAFGNVAQSGVWRYKELIMPHLPHEYIVSLGEGSVPILHAGPNLCKWIGIENLWLILEGLTGTGSFKDYGMTVLISVAKAAGIKVVACSSTGDTSAALAAYAAAAGMKCIVILPRGKVTPVQIVQPLANGALVLTADTDFDGCMNIMEFLVRECGAYPGNSLQPSRIEGHQATAFQIAHFFGWNMPDVIALPVGNGSDCSSVGKGMRLLKQLGLVPESSRILGCQSEAACPLAKSWLFNDSQLAWEAAYKPMKVGETTATAARIGNPVSKDKVMREIIASHGAMEIALEQDLNEAVAVCGKDGIFVCPQTGIALAGIRNAVAIGMIGPNETVVAVSTATGLKFTESAARNLEKGIVDLPDCDPASVAKFLQL